MARTLKNSKANPAKLTPEAAEERAAARQHAISKAVAASTGQDGLNTGNRAKQALRGDNERDLVERP